MYHSRTKHIDVRYHWLREAIDKDELKLSKVSTNDNPADMLTKVVTHEKHKLCADIVGLRNVRQRLEGEICCLPASFSAPFFDIATKSSFDIVTMSTIVENGTTSQRKTIPRVAHKSSPCMNYVNDKVARLCINRGRVFSSKHTKKSEKLLE